MAHYFKPEGGYAGPKTSPVETDKLEYGYFAELFPL